jgi:hypothetical protein
VGYSPYLKLNGWLNLFIRFETLMTECNICHGDDRTAVYAVGRNVLYARELLLEKNPFQNHTDIPYGDDDLAIQSLAGQAQVSVCLDREAHMIFFATCFHWRMVKAKTPAFISRTLLQITVVVATRALWNCIDRALVPHSFYDSFPCSVAVLPAFIAFLLLRWMNYKHW